MPCASSAGPTWSGPSPEPNASIRVLRWKQFIQAEFDSFVANTKKFTDQTGIPVRVDFVSWEDMRPQTAVTANTGAGPDIIVGFGSDPQIYADKLIPMNDLADYLGTKYGGWHELVDRKLKEMDALLRNIQSMKRLLIDIMDCDDDSLAECIVQTGQRHSLAQL